MDKTIEKEDVKTSKAVQTVKNAALAVGVGLISVGSAFAAEGDVSIDLTTGLAGVAIVAGLMSAGALKAVPTYVGWGIKKALSMLR